MLQKAVTTKSIAVFLKMSTLTNGPLIWKGIRMQVLFMQMSKVNGLKFRSHVNSNISKQNKGVTMKEEQKLTLQQSAVSGSASRKPNPYQLVWYKQGCS